MNNGHNSAFLLRRALTGVCFAISLCSSAAMAQPTQMQRNTPATACAVDKLDNLAAIRSSITNLFIKVSSWRQANWSNQRSPIFFEVDQFYSELLIFRGTLDHVIDLVEISKITTWDPSNTMLNQVLNLTNLQIGSILSRTQNGKFDALSLMSRTSFPKKEMEVASEEALKFNTLLIPCLPKRF